MASRKLRLTPFARFFIFLLFAAPLAYLGASYYNGQDGIAKIKDLIGVAEDSIGSNYSQEDSGKDTPTADATDLEIQLLRLQDDLKDHSERIDHLYKENVKLKEELKACQAKIEK